MPTVWVKYRIEKGYGEILGRLANSLPSIVAPQMNVSGRAVHEGGVGEAEVMVEFLEFSPRDRNINDIQVTVIAHAFDERQSRLDEATEAIREGIAEILRDSGNVKVGISIWLVEMGYATLSVTV